MASWIFSVAAPSPVVCLPWSSDPSEVCLGERWHRSGHSHKNLHMKRLGGGVNMGFLRALIRLQLCMTTVCVYNISTIGWPIRTPCSDSTPCQWWQEEDQCPKSQFAVYYGESVTQKVLNKKSGKWLWTQRCWEFIIKDELNSKMHFQIFWTTYLFLF